MPWSRPEMRFRIRGGSEIQKLLSTPSADVGEFFLPRLRALARRTFEVAVEDFSSSSSDDSTYEYEVEVVEDVLRFGDAILDLPAHVRFIFHVNVRTDVDVFISNPRDSYNRGTRLMKHKYEFTYGNDLPDDPFQRELRESMPEPRMSLQAAALRGNPKELQRWKNWGIRSNGGKAQDDTPLHCAARAGDVGAVEELLEQGASISARNLFDHSPLEIAARYGHAAVVQTLLERGAGGDPVDIEHAYAATGSWAVVKALQLHDDAYRKDVSPDQVDAPWVKIMLFRVVQQGGLNILKGLLDMGTNVNCNGILGWTPLQIAVRRGHIRCVSALLEGGADVNSRDDMKWTALHYAAREGRRDIILLLLRAGADMSARSAEGRTPLAVTSDEATRQLLQGYKESEIQD